MYSQSSFLIVSGLFIFMVLAMKVGFRSGLRKQAKATEAITQANLGIPVMSEVNTSAAAL